MYLSAKRSNCNILLVTMNIPDYHVYPTDQESNNVTEDRIVFPDILITGANLPLQHRATQIPHDTSNIDGDTITSEGKANVYTVVWYPPSQHRTTEIAHDTSNIDRDTIASESKTNAHTVVWYPPSQHRTTEIKHDTSNIDRGTKPYVEKRQTIQ